METGLPPDLTSPRRARQLTVAELARHGADELVETAELLVSELVTNVVLHAHTPARLRVSATASLVRIEVTDGSPQRPELREPPLEATDGRGMALIDALAESWGSERTPQGKVVWFELARRSA